jgi:DNA-binding response OmpR family regulator
MKKIYIDTSRAFIERELSKTLKDYSVQSFSVIREGRDLLGGASPFLWIIEISPDYPESLLFIHYIVEERKEPLIVLCRERSSSLKAQCYLLGVDDYVEEPWYPQVIVHRIEAVLKRRGMGEARAAKTNWCYKENRLCLDRGNRRLTVNSREVSLTPSQWEIFQTLVDNENRAVSREYLLNECLPQGKKMTRALDNHMKNLRQNIGIEELIETVRGYGYRLQGELF